MTKLTGEAGEKRAQQTKLIIEGWNGGLTGGELVATHGLTRSAIMSILGRARAKGLYVQPREDHRSKPRAPRNKPKPGIPILAVPPVLATHRPEGNWQKRRPPPPPKLTEPPIVYTEIDPNLLWVGFMDLQENAGCRYSLDAKLFCNAAGYPYCPEHKAIVNPATAQKPWKRRQKSGGRWL